MMLSLTAVPAVAPAAPVVHRLSPAAIEAARSVGESRGRAAEALAQDKAIRGDRKVHGEVGFGVGTGGGREAFGSAVVPLGKGGAAAFDFDYTRFNPRLGYRDR